MKEMLFEYSFLLVIAVAIIFYAIFQWQQFKVLAYKLMLQAKSLAKDYVLASGEAQEKWVLEKIYVVLPKPFRILISKEQMQKIIAYLYHKGKDYLDDGKLNNSI